MALLSLLIVPIVIFCSTKFSVSMENAAEEIQNLNGRVSQIFQEYVWQIPTTRACSVQDKWNRHIHEVLSEVYRSKRKLLHAQILFFYLYV